VIDDERFTLRDVDRASATRNFDSGASSLRLDAVLHAGRRRALVEQDMQRTSPILLTRLGRAELAPLVHDAAMRLWGRNRSRGPVRTRGVVALALCALIGGCKTQPPPTVETLEFPVLVLFEDSGVVRHDDAKDLRRMSVQRVTGSNTPPLLIDSNLDIYRLDGLASIHGGMWLMANPSGRTEVTFELIRVAHADAGEARRLIVEREVRLRHGDDGGA